MSITKKQLVELKDLYKKELVIEMDSRLKEKSFFEVMCFCALLAGYGFGVGVFNAGFVVYIYPQFELVVSVAGIIMLSASIIIFIFESYKRRVGK